MTFYAGVIILTELLMLSMTVHVFNYSGFTKEEKKWYIITFLTIMFCAAAEFVGESLDNRGPSYSLPLTILTGVQFSLTPLIPIFFAGALGMHQKAKYWGVLLSSNAIVEALLANSGAIFYYDANGKYYRGSLYIIYEGFYIVSSFLLILTLLEVGRHFRQRDMYTIIMVMVVMVAALVPLILFHIYTDYLGIGMSACLCYIYYNDLVQEDIKSELVTHQIRITDMQEHIISALANLIENRDTETGEHVFRTSNYVKTLAELARQDGVYTEVLDDHYISLLYSLAPLHDVGKIVVSDSILKKPGKLTPSEFEQMKQHASQGGKVVRSVLEGVSSEEHIQFASQIATCHHERWDGRGYPQGLKGEEIPLCARIMAIADVFDALVSERCYKKAISPQEAFAIIEEGAGAHFDPQLTQVFLNHKEIFIELMTMGKASPVNLASL